MENRFGVKDFFLFLVLGVLIVVVVLGMFQYDRQWALIQQSNQQLSNLTSDVSRIRQIIEQGGGLTARTANVQPSMAGFERILKSHAQPDYAEGDELVQCLSSTPDALTPLINEDAYSIAIEHYLFNYLVELDPVTFKWMPRLAESWKISDDQLTMDFFLRHGVVFSDGSPFSADDVVFTFQWVTNPLVQCPRERSYLELFSGVEKIDEYHVRFHFKKPYFMSFAAVAWDNIYIMSKAFYSKYSVSDFNRSTGLVMGTGPYRLADPTSWTPAPGKPIELLRNERYYGPRPSFNKLIWKVIENPTARATAFQNGETDFYGPGYFGPHPEQYDSMLKNPELAARTQFFALDSPLQGYQFINWNERDGHDGPPSHFADARVRRALTMLIDRDAIVRQVIRGYGTVVAGTFSPLSDQNDPNVKPWPYDPPAAQKLLAEAGFTRQGDRLVGPDGKPFEFKLMYPTGSDVAKRIVPIIHDSLAVAGILLTPDPQEWTVFLKRVDDRQFQAMALGWSGDAPNDDPYQIFSSTQIAGTGDNSGHYDSKDLDAAMDAARTAGNYDQRILLWHKVCQILHRDEPYTFLYAEKELSVIDKRVHGVEPTRLGLLYRIEEWYVPKALQKYTQ